MSQEDYLQAITHCTLCEHRCGVNRLAGQTGICRMTLPAVASAALHPAPPESYTVFMAGCNFKCLNCQKERTEKCVLGRADWNPRLWIGPSPEGCIAVPNGWQPSGRKLCIRCRMPNPWAELRGLHFSSGVSGQTPYPANSDLKFLNIGGSDPLCS